MANAQPLQIEIRGLEGRNALLTNVEQSLTLWPLRGQSLPDTPRLQWLLRQVPDEVALALQPFGFYNPHVVTEQHAENPAQILIQIDPGDTVRYGESRIEFQGDSREDAEFLARKDPPTLRPGEVLNHSAYEAYKGQLGEIALRRGYFEAQFLTSEVLVDIESNLADLTIIFESGPRYQVGPIQFNQSFLNESILRRFIRFADDTPYLDEEILGLQTALIGSRYFRTVTLDAQPDSAAKNVPINFDLVPDLGTYYTVALGYGTDTGPRGSLEVERPLLNRFGHGYQAKALASLVRQGIGGEYRVPGSYPPTDQYIGRFNLQREEIGDQESRRATLGVSQQQIQGNWTTRYSLDYQYEAFQIGLSRFKTSRLLLPSATLGWIQADNRMFAQRGVGVDMTVRGAIQGVLSDVSLVQGSTRARGIYGVNERLRFLQRLELGATWVSDFDALPTSLRFTAGGDGSVRGYNLGAIGPKIDGKGVGGRYLFTTSSEVEYGVFGDFGLAAFVDGGTAFTDRPNMQFGAGVGLRYRSPIGPIRFDIAHGFGAAGELFAISFNLGPDF